MENNVIIASALNSHARIYICDGRQLVEKARQAHDLWPTSCAALGRTLMATALLGMMQKEEGEAVTVTINGGGPIGTILCTADCKGHVKGFCGDPHIYETYEGSHKLAVGKAVGTDGYLKVTRDLKLKQNYTSQVRIQSGEIGDDFACYFSVSEQIPAIVSLGVLVGTDDQVESAGAMIIELLPDHSEEDIVYLENLALRPISSVLKENNDLKAYLDSLFADLEVLQERTLLYECDCSRERFFRDLLTLPRQDLEELSQDGQIEIRCEFCSKEYSYTPEDIRRLLSYVKDQG